MTLVVDSLQAEIIFLDSEPDLLSPFKERMDDFFESAEEMFKAPAEETGGDAKQVHRLRALSGGEGHHRTGEPRD